MSGNQLQSAVESLNQPSLNRFQTSLEPLNQLQSPAEHVNQIQTTDEMSLMYLLQQQQQASNVNTSLSSSSSALMMMSQTTLQSLLMAAIQQHPSASQYIVGTVPTVSVQLVVHCGLTHYNHAADTTPHASWTALGYLGPGEMHDAENLFVKAIPIIWQYTAVCPICQI
jgi:hypothetical protein